PAVRAASGTSPSRPWPTSGPLISPRPSDDPVSSPSRDTVLFVTLPAGVGGSVQSLLTVLERLGGRCRRVVARRPDTTVAGRLASADLVDETIDLGPPGTRRLADALRL